MVDFVELMQRNDVTACQSLINELKQKSATDPTVWEQPLVSIVKAVKHHYHHETLLAILKNLPFAITEVLYHQLLQPDNSFSGISTLVAHINSIPSEKSSASQSLTILLLTAAPSLEETIAAEYLLLKLNGKQQAELLTKLRIESEHTSPPPINQTNYKKYHRLLSFLTTHSFRDEATKLMALGDNPALANLLMSNILERPDLSSSLQKKLVSELLQYHHYYNWEEPFFLNAVFPKLSLILSQLSGKELHHHLKLYRDAARKSPQATENLVLLLDTVYSVNQDTKSICECLVAGDDHLPLLIDFLTRSKTNDASLRQSCLQKIDVKQLATFAGHFIALSHTRPELFTDYAIVFCNHLNNHSHSPRLFEELAAVITVLPCKEKHLAIKTIIEHLASPEQCHTWLHQLLLLDDNKTQLLSYCLKFIERYPDKVLLILTLAKQLNNEGLLALYLQMLTQGFNNNCYDFFKELFKLPDRQGALIHILTHTPAINSMLLRALLMQLNDETLMAFLGELLLVNEQNSEFRTTLDQALLIFCERLYSSAPETKIAQWHQEDNAKQIAKSLLENPACVYQLSLNLSPLLRWTHWQETGRALRHRIDAVLNQEAIIPSRIAQIALTWLEYFRTQPQQLHTILVNLNQSSSNRTPVGETNLFGIKRACWELLKPGSPLNEEELLKSLHAAKEELFDPLLQHLAEAQCLRQDPHRGSIWLAKTKGNFPSQMNIERMVIILLHSVHENNLVNWVKAREWLESCEAEKRLEFVKKALAKVISSNNNPMLDRFFYELITRCTHFNTFIIQLDEAAWYWLFKNSNATELTQRAALWFELMSSTKDLTQINLGKIVRLLPNDQALMSSILSTLVGKNRAIINSLFLQLSIEPDTGMPFDCLYELLTTHYKTSKVPFLKTVINQLEPDKLNSNALELISRLLINHSDEYGLINDYLSVLNAAITCSVANEQSPALRQLQINLIQNFIIKDHEWSKYLTNLDSFTETALWWLNTKDNDCVSNVLVSTKALNIQPRLQNNELFQKLVINMIMSPPIAMTIERFIVLWNLLTVENKIKLATHIFEQEHVHSFHEQNLEHIAEWVTPARLMQLLDKRPTVLLSKALLTHPDGLNRLSREERRRAFDSISSSAQLLDLLNSKQARVRINMVNELFNCFGQDLNKKLGQWLMNAETLAALANFTIDKSHHELLNKIILEKPHYREYLTDYLQKPDQNLQLNEGSFLYEMTKQSLIDAKPIHIELVAQLNQNDAVTVLKLQSDYAERRQGADADHDPEHGRRFTKLLECVLQNKHYRLDQTQHSWIIQTGLLSCPANTLDNDLLQKYLGTIEPKHLAALTIESAKKIDVTQPSARVAHAKARFEQLITLGFGHHDDAQNQQRLYHLQSVQRSVAIPQPAFVRCLSSHAPFFSKHQETFPEFVSLVNNSMTTPLGIENTVKEFGSQVTLQIVASAVHDPMGASNLLQHLINSSCKEVVVEHLQAALHTQLKQSVPSIAALNPEQLHALPSAHFNNALAIQRLLFFAKPIKEFHHFMHAMGSADKVYEKQLFAADASLYLVLSNLENQAPIHLNNERYNAWVTKNCQVHLATYYPVIEAIPDKETQHPYVYYSWLCWKLVTSGQHQANTNILTEGFLNWLKKLNEVQLQNAPELQLLLKQTHDQKLLTNILKHCVIKNLGLSPSQTVWLCENSLKIAPKDRSNLPYVIKLSSWGWLESYMKDGGLLAFELLEFAVENPEYLKSINATESSQAHFLSRLANSNFTLPQLLSLVGKSKDAQVRTLLIIYILSQKSLLDSLTGESIISQLTIKDVHLPARLNSLVHLMDLKTLIPSRVASLQPEAAVNLLCSVPHFHLFTEELIESLLGVYPEKTVISYWTNHFALMPNAQVAMANLFKSADTHVVNALNAMHSAKKEAIIGKVIENLDLYHSIPKILFEDHEENRLILALRLVHNGHQHKHYVTFVNRMMDKLLSKNHAFSSPAIQLIIALTSKKEFSELNNKTAYLTNHYLRANAQQGDVALFYNAGQLSMQALNQLVQLKAPMPNQPSAAREVFGNLIGIKTVTPVVQVATTNIPENPIINELKTNKKMVTALAYFLIHFKGNTAVIRTMLQDLMHYPTTAGTLDSRRQPVEHISSLLRYKEIESGVKEEIFSMLLQNPEFYDDQIRYSLLAFDARRAVQHFGLKGGEYNYRQVISLCAGALKKLNSSENATAIAIAKQAQSEALLELTFHEERGFFANLLRRLKRCWISGWTGFFSPNLPVYVTPASNSRKQAGPKQPEVPATKPKVNTSPDLSQLLKDTKATLTFEKLNNLIASLQVFALQAKPRDELEIRLNVHELYKRLLANRTVDKNLGSWLSKNQEVLVNNEFRLIELKLIKGNMGELQELTKETQGEHVLLRDSIAEFNVPLPIQKPIVVAEKTAVTPEPDVVTATVQSTVRLATDAWSWTSGNLRGFFDSVVPANAANTQNQPVAAAERPL